MNSLDSLIREHIYNLSSGDITDTKIVFILIGLFEVIILFFSGLMVYGLGISGIILTLVAILQFFYFKNI